MVFMYIKALISKKPYTPLEMRINVYTIQLQHAIRQLRFLIVISSFKSLS